jgi:hypothetical protein
VTSHESLGPESVRVPIPLPQYCYWLSTSSGEGRGWSNAWSSLNPTYTSSRSLSCSSNAAESAWHSCWVSVDSISGSLATAARAACAPPLPRPLPRPQASGVPLSLSLQALTDGFGESLLHWRLSTSGVRQHPSQQPKLLLARKRRSRIRSNRRNHVNRHNKQAVGDVHKECRRWRRRKVALGKRQDAFGEVAERARGTPCRVDCT